MNWPKTLKILGLGYFSFYLAGMILPRNLNLEQLQSHNALLRIYVDLLYVSGRLEVILNFLLLVPVFVILKSHFTNLKDSYALLICFSLSVSAEFLQSFIPGRVSSIQDVVLNSTGALCAYLFYILRLRK